MRVALVRQRYSAFGGAERFVERALAALAARDVSLTLITREWSGQTQYPVIICNPFHIGRLWRDWSFARCVSATMACERFSLVQSHERIAGCDVFRAGDGVHAAWLEARSRTLGPLARLAMRLSPWHRHTLVAEERMFCDPSLRAVICISRMVCDDIQRFFGVATDKLHVIYNGIDSADFSPRLRELHRDALRARLGIPLSATMFLYVGSGFDRKGVRQLLTAFAQLRNENAYLVIVGKDKKQRVFEQQTQALGIQERLRFAGAQHDVRPFYGAADVFVLPTLYEPLSNAVLEALASGLPVITSTRCGAAELITQDESGYVCDPLDVDAIAAHMRTLLDPVLRESASLAAARSVQHLTLEKMSEQYVRLYEKLLLDSAEPKAEGAPIAGRGDRHKI